MPVSEYAKNHHYFLDTARMAPVLSLVTDLVASYTREPRDPDDCDTEHGHEIRSSDHDDDILDILIHYTALTSEQGIQTDRVAYVLQKLRELEEFGLQGERKLAVNGNGKRLMETLVVHGNASD